MTLVKVEEIYFASAIKKPATARQRNVQGQLRPNKRLRREEDSKLPNHVVWETKFANSIKATPSRWRERPTSLFVEAISFRAVRHFHTGLLLLFYDKAGISTES